MQKIQGIAFDMEGTIVDVEKAHHEGHLAAAREIGLELTLEDAYRRLPHFIGGPDRKVAEDIYVAAGNPTQTSVDEILASTQGHYEKLLGTMDVALRPGVVTSMQKLWQMGVRVTVGSLTPIRQAQTLIERTGLTAFIPESNIVLAEHVKNPKPAPDVFLETARRMGIDPKHQLVFEDSPRGVVAAKAAGSQAVGMPVVLEPFESTVMPLMKAGAYWIFRDWRDINIFQLLYNVSRNII